MNIDVNICIAKTSGFSNLTPFLNGLKEIAYFQVCHLAISSHGLGQASVGVNKNDEDVGHSKRPYIST